MKFNCRFNNFLMICCACMTAIFLCAAPQRPCAESFCTITQEQAKKIMSDDKDGGVVILDVRTEAEHFERRIPKSTLLPVTEIQARASSVLPNKNAIILVYCKRGNRSKAAANLLASMGYTNVYEFGGIDTWQYNIVSD